MFSRKIVVFAAFIVMVVVVVAILGSALAPQDPYAQNLAEALEEPSWEHLLGTDSLGRDVLSRIIVGARVSLQVGIIAVGIAAGIGMTLGLIAGYFGSWVHALIMRAMDAILSIPPLILALAIAAALGGGLTNVMISLGIALVPVYGRVMCAEVLSVKETEYIMAARVIGCSTWRIMLRHVLPNCFPPLIVLITLQMGIAILAEAALSFLGIGIAPPGAAWGAMVNDGYRYLLQNPLLSIIPGVCIMLVVFSFNLLGDGLRDALDPRLRGTI
jgi:ABC-type dipeptide/oligopeptide/nickel transport system permease subunit